MIKIAFFDVDGTLLNYGSGSPSPKTVHALKDLQKNGVMLCIATGRSNAALPKIPQIDFDIHLTFNGSFVRSEDTVIFSNPLDNDDKDQIIKNLNQMERPLTICNLDLMAANGTDDDLDEYFAFSQNPVPIRDDFDKIAQGDIYQIMCSGVEDEHQKILANTSKTQIAAWWDRAMDIIPANGGKGVAIKAIFEHFGIKKEEAIAFGDGDNDLEMLETVGCGLAMGNAKDIVKKRADKIIRPVDEDGIYYYLLEEGLISEYK